MGLSNTLCSTVSLIFSTLSSKIPAADWTMQVGLARYPDPAPLFRP